MWSSCWITRRLFENTAADIIGHDKPTMDYGLDSGGTSLEMKWAETKKYRTPVLFIVET